MPHAPDAGERDPVPERPSVVSRARAERERLTERATDARRRVEQARGRSGTVDAALRAVEHDAEIGGGVLAAAVGFRVFLFLVPYVFVFVAGFGIASDVAGKSPESAVHSLGIGGLVASTLGDFGRYSLWQRLGALAVGLVALLFAARSLVKTLEIVHALVWRTGTMRVKHVNKAAGVLVVIVTLTLAVGALLGWLRGRSFLGGLVATLLFLAVPGAAWLGVSWLLPHDPDIPWWSLAPGAVFVALGIEVLHLVTVYWIARSVTSKADTYGAIGGALALLLWAYLLGRLIIGSAVLNAALWRRSRERLRASRAATS